MSWKRFKVRNKISGRREPLVAAWMIRLPRGNVNKVKAAQKEVKGIKGSVVILEHTCCVQWQSTTVTGVERGAVGGVRQDRLYGDVV